MLVKFFDEAGTYIEEGNVQELFTKCHIGQSVTLDSLWWVVRVDYDGYDSERNLPFQKVILKADKS